MMIMDFCCRLFGNPVCKPLQCNSNNLSECDYQLMGCCNINGTCTGWKLHSQQFLVPITLP